MEWVEGPLIPHARASDVVSGMFDNGGVTCIPERSDLA